MSTIIDKAIFAVPEYGNRISLFIKKLRIAQYSEGTITNYCHHVSKAVEYLKKIPDDFTQADIDDYLTSPCSLTIPGITVNPISNILFLG